MFKLKIPKKILSIILATLLFLGTSWFSAFSNQQDTIVVRIGEYDGKAGKRTVVEQSIGENYQLTSNKEIMEYRINKPIAQRIARKIKEKSPQYNVVIQDTKDKTEDLNKAGKIASRQDNLRLYLSIHSNAAETKEAKGYMFITGRNATWSDNELANRMSEGLSTNPYVSKRANALNVSYIGELNEVDSLDTIAVLCELGFFTNPSDLKYLTSEEYIEAAAEGIATEISEFLKALDKKGE